MGEGVKRLMKVFIARYYDYDNEDHPVVAVAASRPSILAKVWDRYGERINTKPFYEEDMITIKLDNGKYGAEITITPWEIELPSC